MKRYVFNYLSESTRRGIVHRPVVLLYLKSKEKGWFAFRAYVDSGADISLFMRGSARYYLGEQARKPYGEAGLSDEQVN